MVAKTIDIVLGKREQQYNAWFQFRSYTSSGVCEILTQIVGVSDQFWFGKVNETKSYSDKNGNRWTLKIISVDKAFGLYSLRLSVDYVAAVASTVGSINYTSTPSGATAYLDGVKLLYPTPHTINNIPTGSHTLKLVYGSQSYSTQFNLLATHTPTSPYKVSRVFQTTTATKLTIVPSVTSITEGSQMRFTGKLTNSNGVGIANAKIYFWKDSTPDTQLKNGSTIVSATTDSSGNYLVYWYADNSNLTTSQIHYIYASYGGLTSGLSVTYASCKSTNCSVTIKPKAAVATKTTIAVSPTSVAAGATVTFTGKVLTSANAAVPSVPVTFWTLTSAGQLGTQIKSGTTVIQSTTDSTGSFRATWQAIDLNGTSDNSALRIVAVFAGTPAYIKSQSSYINLTVSPGTGYIQCNSTPSGASVYIDDKLQTVKTPARFSGLAVGTHKVEYRLTGYNNYINNYVVISAAGATATVSTTLVKATVTTILTIVPSVTSIAEGTQMKFTGSLKTSDGKAIPSAKIYFWKDTTIDTQLKNSSTVISATTDSYGNYAVYWYADNSNLTSSQVHNIYAKYGGLTSTTGVTYPAATSKPCSVTITPRVAVATKTTIAVSPTSVAAGATVTFSGKVLTSANAAVPSVPVTFWTLTSAGQLGTQIKNGSSNITSTTNSTGSFSATWQAVDLNGTSDSSALRIVAVFAGTPAYIKSQSSYINLTVSPGTGYVQCNSTPSGASVYIDDKLQTVKTPARFSGLAVGTHKVEYRLTGYNNYINNYVVISAAGSTATVTATLVKGITETALTLNSPGSSFFEGDKVTFSGFLKDATGNPVPDVLVAIYKQNTSLIPDEQLKNGTTLVQARTTSAGYFSVQWTAVDMNTTTSQIHTIIAKFAGNTLYVKSQSRTYDLTIKPKEAVATTLTLTTSTTETKVGGAVILSGTLKTIEGLPVSNATVTFWDDQYIFEGELKNNGVALKATTNSTGAYSVTWTAAIMESLLSSDTVKIYAKYAGHVLYKASQSTPNREVKVNKNMVTPTLSLSVSPTTVAFGNEVTMSGYLLDPSTNKGIANATINIYDKDDILNLTNDLLGTATTNLSGFYAFKWKASSETILQLHQLSTSVEIQAQYNGATEYNKITSDVKKVTVTDDRVLVQFTSVPNKASVKIDGVDAVPAGTGVSNPPNETPFNMWIKPGTHMATFYFKTANMPESGTYQPITKQFTAISGAKVTAEWEAATVCTRLGEMFGFTMTAEECEANLLVKIADIFLDLSSFSRILIGADIYGNPGVATKGDYFFAALTIFPFGEAWKAIKALKGMNIDTMGAVFAKAVAGHPELIEVLDTSLFFNRFISMDGVAQTKLMHMFEEMITTSGKLTTTKLNELQEFLESFPFKAIPTSKLAKAQSELAKILPDAEMKRCLDFLQRTLPAGIIAKSYTTIFNKFLAGNAIPTPTQLLDLANAAKANPDDILDLISSYRLTQLQYVHWKLRYLGGPNSVAGRMINEWIQAYGSTDIADKAAAIKRIAEEFAPKIASSARSYVPADVQAGIMNLASKNQNAVYAISKSAGDRYLKAMEAAFAKYSEPMYGKAVVETVVEQADIIVDTIKATPTQTIISPSKTAISTADEVLDNVAGSVPIVLPSMKLKAAKEITEILEECHSTITQTSKSAIVEIYKGAAGSPPAFVKNVDDFVKFVTTELPEIVSNKGTKFSSYTALNPNTLINRIPSNVLSANLVENFVELRHDVMGILNDLRKAGILPTDESILSPYAKNLWGFTDEIIETIPTPPEIITETLESLNTKLASYMLDFAETERKLADAYLDNIIRAGLDFDDIILSDGTKLSSKNGFRLIDIFKRIVNDIASLGANERTGSNVARFVRIFTDDLHNAFLQLLDEGYKLDDIPSTIGDYTKEIIKTVDEAVNLPTTPEVIEEIVDTVSRYTDLFSRILRDDATIRITAATISDLIDYIIKNPSKVYDIIPTSGTTELINKLYGRGAEGKILAEFIRLMRNCRGFQSQIASEASFDAFITATAKAAKKVLESGKDPTLMRLWDTLFDITGDLKPLDTITKSKSYSQLYSLVYSLGNNNTSQWIPIIIRWIRAKIISTNAKSLVLYGPMGAGGHTWGWKSGVVMWLAFEAGMVYYTISFILGVNPTQVSKTSSSYVIGINTLLSELDEQCDHEKTDQYSAILERAHAKIEEYRTFRQEHDSAIKGDVAGLGEFMDSELATFDARIKQYDDCNAATGTTPGTASDFKTFTYELQNQLSAIESIYYNAIKLCGTTETAAITKARQDISKAALAFNEYVRANTALISANSYAKNITTYVNQIESMLTALHACETGENGELPEGDIKGVANSYIYGLGPMYDNCQSYCDNGSSKYEGEMEEFKNMIDDATEFFNTNKDALATMNLAIQLKSAITVAEGRYDMLSTTCGSSVDGPVVSPNLYTIITTLLKDLDNTEYACSQFFKNGANASLNAMLPLYADQLTQLQTIITDQAPDVETLGMTKELSDKYTFYYSWYDYYLTRTSDGTQPTELPEGTPFYEQLDTLISNINTFYWHCYNAKKEGRTADFNENLAIYKDLIAELTSLQSSKSAEIADIGYTETVKLALADAKANLAKLTSTSSGSTAPPSTTPDDSDTSGGYYTNESLTKAANLIDSLQSNSTTCWTLCKNKSKSALAASLKTYKSNFASLESLYNGHLPELEAAGAKKWVADTLTYHRTNILKLEDCAGTTTESPGGEEPVDEPDIPDTTDMTDEEVIDTVDQLLDDMESIWDEAQNATVTEEVV